MTPRAKFPILVAVLLAAPALAWLLAQPLRPAPLNQARRQERERHRDRMQAESQQALSHYGWADARRGVVRLPLARAMELTARDWAQPASGRSNLLQRLARAQAEPNPPVKK